MLGGLRRRRSKPRELGSAWENGARYGWRDGSGDRVAQSDHRHETLRQRWFSKNFAPLHHATTAQHAVHMLVTELAVFRFIDGKMWLTEIADGCDLATVRAKQKLGLKSPPI